jgi:hypothetical protein
MKSYYRGLDFLRGLGIFFVVMLHTGFYFYHDIYDIDLDNPSLVVTLIGFLLMFAGLFAMISGVSHTLSYLKHMDEKQSRIKYMLTSGGLLLFVAYVYFLFTGPGIILFESRSMDESLLVSLINQGKFQALTLERIFYVDSLVMLGLNIILLAVLFKLIKKHLNNPKIHLYILIFATVFMAISYLRIPLYHVYLNAKDNNQFAVMLLLNWFVAKNNPILPFYAFALFGVWIALLLKKNDLKYLKKWMIPTGITFVIVGIIGYILAPETMLERAIDGTWYFIMVTQIGLFMIMTLIALTLFDFKKHQGNFLTRFISRFGVAGLTVFFIESVVSAFIFLLVNILITVEFGIPGAILYGLTLAVLWGFVLMFWEKKQYRYGVEYFMGQFLSHFGTSSKSEKLKGVTRD